MTDDPVEHRLGMAAGELLEKVLDPETARDEEERKQILAGREGIAAGTMAAVIQIQMHFARPKISVYLHNGEDKTCVAEIEPGAPMTVN